MVRTPSTCATRLRISAQFLTASSRQKSRSLTTNDSAPLSLPAANSQLGTSYIDRLPTPNRQPIEVLHSEIDKEDVAPGQTSAGVLAIKTKDSTPTLYQFVFGSDKVSPVVAQAVL